MDSSITHHDSHAHAHTSPSSPHHTHPYTHAHVQVTKAVIAVPAKFDARQKRATGEAYRRAGLKVFASVCMYAYMYV